MRGFFIAFLALSLFLGSGCTPVTNTPNTTLSDEAAEAAGQRLQTANVEITQLLMKAADADVDIAEYQARWSEATLKSATDLEGAADDMEALRDDLNLLVE